MIWQISWIDNDENEHVLEGEKTAIDELYDVLTSFADIDPDNISMREKPAE